MVTKLCYEGKLFSSDLQKEIKERFHFVDEDQLGTKRLFFDNAGGSFRLKSSLDSFQKVESIGDCPERIHKNAIYLTDIVKKGEKDIRTILNASNGSIFMSLSASKTIFEITGVIAENVAGNNIVTTMLEHPSAYDACEFYAKKTGKELRIAKSNCETGAVDIEEIVKLIDNDTCLLSIIYASNISGAILDIEEIIKKAREVKPDLFIICDAVQHAPHGKIDVDAIRVDAINFAPYKFFGVRGSGVAYVSDRVASLPHHKLIAKPSKEWNLGSPAPAQYAAISEIVGYVCWLGEKLAGGGDRKELFDQGMKGIALHERALLFRLLNGSKEIEGLRNMNGVKVLLDYPDLSTRDLIVAIEIEGMDFTEAVKRYEEKNVIVYERVSTSLYSKRIVESLGLKGAIRISPIHCHDIDDIDTFLRITKEIVKGL
ncbi:aminotransferase class V-fold PLP-dependent enzyme [Tissierella praeacuta]|uniref:aminotransferase class V-fold PLP-dependent enzyme n=1 Tax=Tissierella praeacuta TaxID=43131 RepID=UPI001C10FF03|nr:aminotransferase class V-fold PLP-dependent enzyme [Tissierella praeacuta]MBU5256697.1 aminotransferase class V-fold PLP-dependent enzyme [Tissierella praeacuta]